MSTGVPLMTGDACPRCNQRVSDVWGPATERKRRLLDGHVVEHHKVVHTLRCDHCGWHRVEDVVDTDEMMEDLLQSLKP